MSDIKEAKAGGRPLYYFELAWPSLSAFKEEAEDEGDADSGRCACIFLVHGGAFDLSVLFLVRDRNGSC